MSQDLLATFRPDVPAPGDTAEEHLAHTLACFADVPSPADLASPVGLLTVLRRLDNADARAILAHLAADQPPADFALRATSGIYGDGVTTGVTWGDVKFLIAQR